MRRSAICLRRVHRATARDRGTWPCGCACGGDLGARAALWLRSTAPSPRIRAYHAHKTHTCYFRYLPHTVLTSLNLNYGAPPRRGLSTPKSTRRATALERRSYPLQRAR